MRSGPGAPVIRAASRYAPFLVLAGALFLFISMFMAANSLERTADASHFIGEDGSMQAALAERYAYEWRHGMAGQWPLFAPGFFAIAIAVAVWAPGLTTRSLLAQGGLALLLAAFVAFLLAPLGAKWIVSSFENDTGLALSGSREGAAWSRTSIGILTAVSWAVLVFAARACVTHRSVLPLLIPLVLYVALTILRPGALGDLVQPWSTALWGKDSVAIFSTLLIPVVAAILWCYTIHATSTEALRSSERVD